MLREGTRGGGKAPRPKSAAAFTQLPMLGASLSFFFFFFSPALPPSFAPGLAVFFPPDGAVLLGKEHVSIPGLLTAWPGG